MDRYDITIQMLGVEAPGPQYVWEKVPAEEGELVLYTDAQATIAALQARVKELEEITKVICGHCCEPMEIPSKAVLQSALTQRTAECDALKLVNDTHMKTVMKLSHVVEQRTAELEAAKREVDVWKEKAELRGKEACAQRAELERVSLLSSHNERRFEMLEKKYKEFRTLLLALPKVEGEIEVSSGVYNFILLKHDSGTRFLCGQIETEQTAKAYAALLQHRQGMEG